MNNVRKLKMNYRFAPLSKYEKTAITKFIKKLDLADGSHLVGLDVGKSFIHKIEIVLDVYNYDDFKNDGITYEYVKMVTLISAKYVAYETRNGYKVKERIINF